MVPQVIHGTIIVRLEGRTGVRGMACWGCQQGRVELMWVSKSLLMAYIKCCIYPISAMVA